MFCLFVIGCGGLDLDSDEGDFNVDFGSGGIFVVDVGDMEGGDVEEGDDDFMLEGDGELGFDGEGGLFEDGVFSLEV